MFTKRKSLKIRDAILICCVWLFAGGCQTPSRHTTIVPKWHVFEVSFSSTATYDNPPQETEVDVSFWSPSGATRRVSGFWDGGSTWRVRFAPDEVGRWAYKTACSQRSDVGLNDQFGSFTVVAAQGSNPFHRHGPVQVAPTRRHFEHQDRVPFFVLADTAWNGPLKTTAAEWTDYLTTRKRQGFNTIQWVATPWRGAPDRDRLGRPAFEGRERIRLNPNYFQRLDQKVALAARAGFLNAPALLWALDSGGDLSVNPGAELPEDQAILLARHMIARWGAYPCLWLLAGDGENRNERAERWKRIGRTVFAEREHGPVSLHPGGRPWIFDEFRDETWIDFLGYRSGDRQDAASLRWTWKGPQTTDWDLNPIRPILNLAPKYEDPIAHDSQNRIQSDAVRRAAYWSLLTVPPSGIGYGALGVWGFNDGTGPPVGHPNAGPPSHWRSAIQFEGARQMGLIRQLFESIDYWTLRPDPGMVASQPGEANPARFIAAARSESGHLAVVYSPSSAPIGLARNRLPSDFVGRWINPRTGKRHRVTAVIQAEQIMFTPPDEGDWALVLEGGQTRF